MADQTADEIKKANIAKMGEALGAQFSELRQELIRAHVKWAEFIDLFGTKKETVDLLKRAASQHFHVAHNSLWESLILDIACLTDPPKSVGKPNLTVQRLPALVPDTDVKSQVANLVEIALKECEFCRDWRNEIFAHNHLDIALKDPAKAVPTTTKAQVDAALKSLANVLNAVETRYTGAQTAFNSTIRHSGAPALISVLSDGIKARDQELDRLKREIDSADTPLQAHIVPKDKVSDRSKLKARLPRGLADRGPAEIAATRRMIEAIRAVYERYGFEAVETPAFEYTDALGKFLPDQDRPNEGVFSFQDDDEQWLSLRYDLTAPLARYVAENFDALPKPYRSYREGWVFRNEKPGPGRYRQFMQFDADTVGAPSVAADAEICMMAADTMEALGLEGKYIVKVNNRKVLDGVLESMGLGGEGNVGKRLTVLRALDKRDRLGDEGVRQLLGEGRVDESGDRTEGARLSEFQIEKIDRYLAIGRQLAGLANAYRNNRSNSALLVEAALDELQKLVVAADTGGDGVSELRQIAGLVREARYDDGRIVIDPTVVRGLEYYTGPVYEVELLDTKDEKGRPVRFGSVGGGGRYDGLVSRFRGEPVPATGFSIGVSRLMAALQHLKIIDTKPEPGPVVVTVFDQDRIADYQKMVAALRNAEYTPGKNIRAELYLGSGKFGAQMKYADKRGSPCVVIQGGDEKAKGEVQIKDLILGATLTSMKGRDEYLKKQGEAQFACREDELVAKVREVLARHDVNWG